MKKIFSKFYCLVFTLLCFNGCQNKIYVEPDVNFSHVDPLESRWEYPENSEGSIYARGFKMNFFGSARDWKVGDLITVQVSEKSTIDTKSTNKTGRKANSSVTTPKLFGMIPSAGDVNLDMALGTDNNYEGEYNQKQTQKIDFHITATVAHIYPNGHLLLKGEKEFYSNGTKEFMCLHGIARPDDIYADNTIKADRLGDLKLQIGQEGQLFKGADAGWLTKFLSLVYPF